MGAFEVNGDFADAPSHTFSGANVERNAIPAPIIDMELHGDVGLSR